EMRWSDSGRVVLEVALARLMIGATTARVEKGEATPIAVPEARSASPAPTREPSTSGGRRVAAEVLSAERGAAVEGGRGPADSAGSGPLAGKAPAEAGESGSPEEFDPFEHVELPPSVAGRHRSSGAPAGGSRQPASPTEPEP